jgi:uncharacterized membrane protein
MTDPIKPSLKTEIVPLLFCAAAFVASYYFYQHFPERVITHWNFAGQPDGYGSRAVAAFVIPTAAFAMYLFLLFLPWLDPKKDRYQEFARFYHLFRAVITIFFVATYFLTSLNNLGYALPIAIFIPIMIGILFIFIGNYMGKVRPNWFMGLRNPWTLSNEEIWNKSNRFAGKLFILGGLAMMLQSLVPINMRLGLLIATVIMIAVVPNLYSFILFRRLKK